MLRAGEVYIINFKAAVRRESVCFKFASALARLRSIFCVIFQ